MVKIWRKFSKNFTNFAKFWKKTATISAIFNENFEISERCKGVHCVDLGESFPTSIYLQNLASIQPRTSPKKFGKTGKRDFEISFAFSPVRAFEIGGQGSFVPPPALQAGSRRSSDRRAFVVVRSALLEDRLVPRGRDKEAAPRRPAINKTINFGVFRCRPSSKTEQIINIGVFRCSSSSKTVLFLQCSP